MAWIASFCLLAWLWYFVELHLVRYSHAGRVCFGDFSIDVAERDTYLISEGSFIRYLITTQWLICGLIAFGMFSNFVVILMRKFEENAIRKRRERRAPMPNISPNASVDY